MDSSSYLLIKINYHTPWENIPMRKMASVRKIDSITPIEGADMIVCAHIGGWPVVVKKDEHSVGDLVVYCEPDSWVPHEMAPFLSKGKTPREYKGVAGEKLRTVKLRGQLSQGLVLPVSVLGDNYFEEGMDVSEILGIQKWEMEVPTQLRGQIKGSFPSFFPKTDQERVQNLSREIEQWVMDGSEWEATEKLDGSSMSCYIREGEFGVCSRNIDLKRDEENAFWKTAIRLNIEQQLRDVEGNWAIQGELIGPGIQGNPYGLDQLEYYVYDVFDIDRKEYLTPLRRDHFIYEHTDLPRVPLIENCIQLKPMEELLKMAEGFSVLAKCKREGLVFKSWDGKHSFKAISNDWLLNEK